MAEKNKNMNPVNVLLVSSGLIDGKNSAINAGEVATITDTNKDFFQFLPIGCRQIIRLK